jgi:hypothetical protein
MTRKKKKIGLHLGLFRSLLDGLWHRPILTLRNIWALNPRARKSWKAFGLRVHGGAFLSDFIAASREAGMKPFLMWGTLLGHVREGGLLKHDKDLDMGILAIDWPKRDALIEAMHRRGYELRHARDYKIVFERRDRLTRMDIDVFFPWEGKVICLSRLRDGSFRGAWFRPNAFEKFRTSIFLGSEVLIPDPPESVLEAIYGDWRTPIKSYDSTGSIPNRLTLESAPQLPPSYVPASAWSTKAAAISRLV